jgi:hypothetical protein
METSYPVQTISGRQVVVLERASGLSLVAELPYHDGGYPETVEIVDRPEYDGMGVDVIANGRRDCARLTIYADRHAGESHADVVERLGLDEENLLPGVY